MKKTTKITTQRAVTTIRRRAPTYQKLLKTSTPLNPLKKVYNSQLRCKGSKKS